jgi:adenylate cyclase
MSTSSNQDPDFSAVLGAPREFSSAEVSERAGIPTYRARRYWRALGFANVPDGEREFTEADIDALSILLGLVGDGVLDEAQAVEFARNFGRAAGRLANGQAESLVAILDASGASDEARSLAVHQRLDLRLPDFEKLLVYTWRRHLAVAMQRVQPHVSTDQRAKLTVGFADLVGFTELSRRLSEQELGSFVRRFESGLSDLVIALGGRVIKSLGDEILFVADTPAAAADIALEIVERARRRTTSGIRIGLELGTVITHAGDVFGDTVNLASRLTTLAEPNHILLGPALAESLRDSPTFALTTLPPVEVRGFGSTIPTELRWATHT